MTDAEVRACQVDAIVSGLLTRAEEELRGAQLPPRWVKRIRDQLRRLDGIAQCAADTRLERIS